MLSRLLTFCLLLLATPQAFADGKMYAEKVSTKIPYQRALILHDEGMQMMILQSQYEIPNKPGTHKLGWVVPVPDVPEIQSMDARGADSMFRTISYATQPKPLNLGFYLQLGSLLILGAVVYALINYFLDRHYRNRKRLLVDAFLVIFILISILFVLLSGARAWKGIRDVEIVQSGKVGIYNTQVVKSQSSEALLDWFKSQSFTFHDEDKATIQSYIDRGWCFVTATVDAFVSMDDSANVSSNLLAPLILLFPSPNPIYPTALTATGGHPTEILIYLGAKTFMKSPSNLEMKFSGPRTSMVHSTIIYNLMPHDDAYADWLDGKELAPSFDWLLEHFENEVVLHKFKATLTPQQMRKDIEFLPDPDGKEYRETVIKW